MNRRVLDRRRVHLHGLVAGSLLVLAAFVVWTVPAAVARLFRGQVTASTLLPPAAFALLFGGGIREARAWNRSRSAQAI